MRAGMFDLIHHCYAAKSMLAEIYVHPNEVHDPAFLNYDLSISTLEFDLLLIFQEGYIGDAENWEYANRFIQPVRCI